MRQTDDYWVINTGSEEDPGINRRLSKRIPDQIGITTQSQFHQLMNF